MCDDGGAQVALQHPANIKAILHHHRPVKPVHLEQFGMTGGINAAFTGEGFNGVTRNLPNQEKGDESHADEGRIDEA